MGTDSRAKDIDMRVRADLLDSFDEELEMEIDDERLDKLLEGMTDRCRFRRHTNYRTSVLRRQKGIDNH